MGRREVRGLYEHQPTLLRNGRVGLMTSGTGLSLPPKYWLLNSSQRSTVRNPSGPHASWANRFISNRVNLATRISLAAISVTYSYTLRVASLFFPCYFRPPHRLPRAALRG